MLLSVCLSVTVSQSVEATCSPVGRCWQTLQVLSHQSPRRSLRRRRRADRLFKLRLHLVSAPSELSCPHIVYRPACAAENGRKCRTNFGGQEGLCVGLDFTDCMRIRGRESHPTKDTTSSFCRQKLDKMTTNRTARNTVVAFKRTCGHILHSSLFTKQQNKLLQ